MGKRSMEIAMAAARRGEIDLDALFRSTGKDWGSLAANLAARWPLPAGVDEEDVQQEMLLGVLEGRLIDAWDPAAGPTLARYVVWNACSAGARWMHQQRAALRRSGKAAGRHAVPFSAIASREGRLPEVVESSAMWRQQEVSPDAAVEWRELLALVGVALKGAHRIAFFAFVEELGDVERAAERINEDPELGLACRVGSVEEAEEVVRAAIAEVRKLARR